ncbi:hypothetical protein ACF1BB_13085 [Streptomyces griseoluteus]
MAFDHEEAPVPDALMITSYPPCVPAVLPGERLTEPVLRHLDTGVRA